MEKHYLSADDYLRDQWRLAELVRGGGWRPDFLVGLWRGGAPVAIAVHEFLKCTGWDVRHIPLKCASYTGIGQNEGKVVFTFGDEIFGKTIYIVGNSYEMSEFTGETFFKTFDPARRAEGTAVVHVEEAAQVPEHEDCIVLREVPERDAFELLRGPGGKQ